MEEDVERLSAELEAKDIVLNEEREQSMTYKRQLDYLLDMDGGDAREGLIKWNAAWVVRENDREQELLRLETELAELRAHSHKQFDDLVDDVEAQGFRPSYSESAAEAHEKLHHFLKQLLPRQTVEMLEDAFSGISRPRSLGGGGRG